MKEQDEDLIFLMADSHEAIELNRSQECLSMEFSNKDESLGEGLINVYSVFPGVYLQFNDFRMDEVYTHFNVKGNFLCLDHCREGRLHSNDYPADFYNLGAGGLVLSATQDGRKHIQFPLGHFYGITITFDLDSAMEGISKYAPTFPVDPKDIVERFNLKENKFPLQNIRGLDNVFDDLYAVPAHIRIAYFKVKILELLLYLSAIEIPEEDDEKPYFYKTQVQKVREMHQMITNRLDQRFSLKDLSARYNMSVPAMEKCFRGLYGNSIAKYMREYRMNQATILLRNNHEKSVLEIALEMGYNSPGKFSTAFKEIIGMSPLNYRKNFDRSLARKISQEKRSGKKSED